MRIKNRIIRDTLLLTAMQLFLDTASLMLSSFMTRKLGAAAVGMYSLMGSFLGLAGILSNGNAFLCTSRLVSEETGNVSLAEGGEISGRMTEDELRSRLSDLVPAPDKPVSFRFWKGWQRNEKETDE